MLVIIVAYGFSGILIFGKNMETFSAFKKTSYVLFEMGLGRPFGDVFADDMKRVDRVMGPLYFSTFVLVFITYLVRQKLDYFMIRYHQPFQVCIISATASKTLYNLMSMFSYR